MDLQSRTDLIRQPEATLGHHLQSLIMRDIEAVLSDYGEESILFTPTDVFTGLDQLRVFFLQFVETLTPEFLGNFKLDRQEIRGDYAYITWSSGSSTPLGTDTFCIRNGKIVMQSFAAYMSP
jgi:hypothetical protein